MSYDYNGFVSQISNLMVQVSTGANFTTALSGIIDNAEQRIYRELDLLNTRSLDTATTLTPNSRFTALSTVTGPFVVVENINVLTPAGTLSSNGIRTPLTRVTKEYLDFAWPNSTNTGIPIYFADLDNTTFLFGPAPNAAYVLEITATERPPPLSASNTTTFLTQSLPDLFMAAAMVFGSAYMRDFGAMADDPNMGATWERYYQTLFVSANNEELRKKFQSQGWQSKQPNNVATPPRT
jgi:hypothetical protein